MICFRGGWKTLKAPTKIGVFEEIQFPFVYLSSHFVEKILEVNG